MRFKKKTLVVAITAGLVVSSIGWAGWLVWTGPNGPTHVTILPYIQPGTNAVPLNGFDSSRLVWVARGRPAEFSVDYGLSSAYGRTTTVQRVELAAVNHAQKYLATLLDLPLDATIFYRVRQGQEVVREGSFAVRKSATNTIHFVAVGDTVHAQQVVANCRIGPPAVRHLVANFGDAERRTQRRFHRRLARTVRTNERAIDIEQECLHD